MIKEVIIKRRPKLQRLIRIPNMWVKQWRSLKGVSLGVKISFLWSSAKIVMKDYKNKL